MSVSVRVSPNSSQVNSMLGEKQIRDGEPYHGAAGVFYGALIHTRLEQTNENRAMKVLTCCSQGK